MPPTSGHRGDRAPGSIVAARLHRRTHSLHQRGSAAQPDRLARRLHPRGAGPANRISCRDLGARHLDPGGKLGPRALGRRTPAEGVDRCRDPGQPGVGVSPGPPYGARQLPGVGGRVRDGGDRGLVSAGQAAPGTPRHDSSGSQMSPEPGLQMVVAESTTSAGQAASATPVHDSSGSQRSPEPGRQMVVSGVMVSAGQAAPGVPRQDSS